MRTTVCKEIEFDAGHRVPDHASRCRNPHGHRYRVRVHVEGPVQPPDGRSEGGMVIDFAAIKEALTAYHDEYDHGFIVWEHDVVLWQALKSVDVDPDWRVVLVGFIPTAEHLAADALAFLASRLDRDDVRVTRVDVWETPTSRATVVA